MKKPMKKLLSILFLVALFCTMVTWPSRPVEAAIDSLEIQRRIDAAPSGSTLEIDLGGGQAYVYKDIVINKPITIKFKGEPGVRLAGNDSYADFISNRAFIINSSNVHLDFGEINLRMYKDGDGGAIYINKEYNGNKISNVSIKGGIFSGSGSSGGAIYVEGENVSIENCRFGYEARNTFYARKQGGAIYVAGNNTTIKNCQFNYCEAWNEGGAICISGDGDNANILNCTFFKCESLTEDGGAIFVRGNDATISGCHFEECKAGLRYKSSDDDGGAIKLSTWGKRLRVERCSFKNCEATRDGDWVDGDSDTTIVHCTKPYNEPYYYSCTFPSSSFECNAGSLSKIDNDKPSCTKAGIKPYWVCDCGSLYSGPNPSSSNRIDNLEAWKADRSATGGYDEPLGHDLRYWVSASTSKKNLTFECTRNKSHKTSITLLEKDSTYPGITAKVWQDVVSGDKNEEFWSQLAGQKIDFDVRYYVDTPTGWELTSPQNSGSVPDPSAANKGGFPPKNAGSYKLVVQVYQGTTPIHEARIEQPFTIHPKQITSQMVTIDPVDAEYKESGTTVTVTAADGSDLTVSDYTVSGETYATAPGSHTVTVTGKGNYTGTAYAKWSIRTTDPLWLRGSLSAVPITYGEKLSNASIKSDGCSVTSGGKSVAGTFAWEDPNIVPDKVGTATYNVVFTPIDPTYGILKTSVSVRVDAKDISKSVTINTPDTYNGNDLIDYIEVVDKISGDPYVRNIDYDVTCKPTEVKEPGDYTATVKFKGNYTGTVTQDFKIIRNLTEDDLTFIVNEAYEGDNTHEAITIKLDDKTLERGTDYDISGILDESKAPLEYKYTANIKFKGKYAGEIKDKVFVATYPIPDPGPTPAPTPTPDPGPYTPSPSAPSSAPSAPTGTIGGNTGGKITVTTYDGNATLSDVPVSVIDNAANSEAGTDLVLDVSGTSRGLKKISRVTIPKKTIENVVTVLNSPTNNKDRLVITFDTATIAADAKSLASIVRQAKGEKVQFVVEAINQTGLNDGQKSIVDGFNNSTGKKVEQIFQAYVESNGSRVPEFDGGIITVGMADYKVPAGKNEKNFHIYYLSPEGKREHCVTWIENKTLYFGTGHFSDYAIVYDETMLNGPGNEVYRLYNSENGDHLFTISKAEKDAAQKGGWKYDGVSFIAIEEGNKVYRLLDPGTGEHIFTESTKERDALSNAGWIIEGVAFLSYGETEVSRLIFPGGMHMFTANEKEKDALVADGWIYEGVAFKAN